MCSTKKNKVFLIFCLAIVLTIMSFPKSILAGSPTPFSQVKEKLEGISKEEKVILQNLFAISHEIEQMGIEEKGIAGEIEVLNKDIRGFEETISDKEKACKEKRDVLKQVLQVYQIRGPGSYLEIILDSENLNMLLWRINTLQDLSRNTENILESLEQSKKALSDEKAALSQKLALIEDKQKQLKKSLDEKLKLKKDKEEYLASLGSDKGKYLEQLDNLQQAWRDLKPFFSKTSEEFSRIIEDGKLPLDAVKVSLTLNGIEGIIDEKAFNDIGAGLPGLSKMSFRFYPDRADISLPEKNLMLSGTFRILDGNILQFVAQGGSFYGVSLDTEAIDELFKEGYLAVDLKPLIGDNILKSAQIGEGNLKFLFTGGN